MGRMTDDVLGHADESDGIEEYDNPLPDWWIGMFILTIVFAGIYPVWHHGVEGNTQADAYLIEMAEAEQRWPRNEGVVDLPLDDETIAAGAEIFTTTCASCHKADLSGGIGPSLVDAEWIHGGTGPDIVKTVTDGVSDKGMPAWGAILGPKKVLQVAAFVLSKQVLDPVPASGEVVAAVVPAGTPEGHALDGEALFAANCAVCHKADMTGQVGPNLIDSEWIHGGELAQIQKTITDGVPEKGMVAWGPILGPEKIEVLARYVHDASQEDGAAE
jgi:cytochrome c oxidase cbb3-type subunit 3